MPASSSGSERRGSAADLLIFLHLPKTGGTTISRILQREYRNRRIWNVGREGNADTLARLSPSERASIDLVWGHIGFGVHRLFPQRAAYLTLLRDPVARIVSHYHYVRSAPQHRLHRQVVDQNMSLLEYACSDLTDELVNDQVRQLSERAQAQDICDRECLEEAKRNLAEWFPVAGTTERFDETLLLLQRAFGWRWPGYVPRNVGDAAARAPLDEETREVILERNALDHELHRFVGLRVDEEVAAAGLPFARALRRFRLVTTAGRQAAAASQPLRRALGRL